MTDSIDKIIDDRGKQYGTFEDRAQISQSFKVVMYGHLGASGKSLSSDQLEALEMIFGKISRIINGNADFADSWDDIAGYAKLVGDRLRGVAR